MTAREELRYWIIERLLDDPNYEFEPAYMEYWETIHDRLRAKLLKQQEAMQAALEALEWAWGGEPLSSKEHEAITLLRAALSDAEDDAWELDYEVRVESGDEDMWVAGASTSKEALYYATQYVEEGTVRVYERRMKVIATLEADHD